MFLSPAVTLVTHLDDVLRANQLAFSSGQVQLSEAGAVTSDNLLASSSSQVNSVEQSESSAKDVQLAVLLGPR